jgi:hypothetical protein
MRRFLARYMARNGRPRLQPNRLQSSDSKRHFGMRAACSQTLRHNLSARIKIDLNFWPF